VVNLLLENKADVDAEDRYGLTTLQLAAFEGQETVERLLAEIGASEPTDFYGLQALVLEDIGEARYATFSNKGHAGSIEQIHNSPHDYLGSSWDY
jgi:ankyrin repeat protein